MIKKIHLWPQGCQKRNGCVRISARLEIDPYHGELIWFEVPEEYVSAIAEDADPFVVALALRMAQEDCSVHVHGTVSPSLLMNLEKYIGAWSIWRPQRFSPIEITADNEQDRNPPDGPLQVISGFSGGVDSLFTAYRHVKGITTKFPEPLTAGIMVRGFDIPLEEEDMFTRACAKARRQLSSLDLETIEVSTNYRSIDVPWTLSFGAAVASVMMLFGKRFSRGLIAQGVPYGSYRVLVEGSNPLTDPLLSSSGFTVIPDGGAFGRPEKVAVIAEWTEGVADLRVCTGGIQKDRNCCKCEKCIRTILTFRALGFGSPPCFEHDVSDAQILGLYPLRQIKLSVAYFPLLQAAENRGLQSESWVKALRRVVQRSRRALLIGQAPGVRDSKKLKSLLRGLISHL